MTVPRLAESRPYYPSPAGRFFASSYPRPLRPFAGAPDASCRTTLHRGAVEGAHAQHGHRAASHGPHQGPFC
ncbi:hypothetical protein B0T16DRAFT_402626 [Cercophora newfieldiana]|uniref:Uncharacterized protein n=1 Tax=Cercophora newfieldiana TaxID=92897 RepID=A0AA39YUI9_9PEZI|nr:hypothetical protein B0T16DRAFT_402626 [Cercophora newfieldiana]